MDIIATLINVLTNVLAGVLALLMGLGAHITAITPAPAALPTTTTTVATSEVFPEPALSAPAQAPTPAPTPTTPSSPAPAMVPPGGAQSVPSVDPDALNVETRAALVNVLCTTLAGGTLAPISGSGVVIDGRGVILTNAHVGQFFLLRDYGTKGNVNCVIRTGSPAQTRYRAELLYLQPAWVAANADQIKAQQATGTGENDYALLIITGTTNPAGTLPSSFPHLAMSTAAPDIGSEMLLAAYPAGFLSGELISSQLYASSAFAYVTQLFTFDDPAHVDIFSIGGSIESQAGSSGGAVVRLDGTLAGVITTATLAESTGQRDLRAITIAHINRSLKAAGLGGIAEFLSNDLAKEAAAFNADVAPAETAALEAVLDSTH